MNNEIETLYPVKKKKNLIPILILITVIIGIAIGFGLKKNFFREKEKGQKQQTKIEDIVSTVNYACYFKATIESEYASTMEDTYYFVVDEVKKQIKEPKREILYIYPTKEIYDKVATNLSGSNSAIGQDNCTYEMIEEKNGMLKICNDIVNENDTDINNENWLANYIDALSKKYACEEIK